MHSVITGLMGYTGMCTRSLLPAYDCNQRLHRLRFWCNTCMRPIMQGYAGVMLLLYCPGTPQVLLLLAFFVARFLHGSRRNFTVQVRKPQLCASHHLQCWHPCGHLVRSCMSSLLLYCCCWGPSGAHICVLTAYVLLLPLLLLL